MKILTRLSTSISAAVDRAVTGIENHDAVIEAAINDIRRNAGEARARLNRLRNETRRLDERRGNLRTQAAQWASRATQQAIEEDVALECVRRKRACERQAADLDTQIAEQEALQERVAANIEQIETQLTDLKRKRTLLRSREAVAETETRTSALAASEHGLDIQDTLERWEAKIAGAEIEMSVMEAPDALERRFEQDEQRMSLAAELAELRNNREA